MVKIYIKLLMILFASVLTFSSGAQVTITEWNFDNETLLPSTGSGTAENIGGTNTAFVTGDPGRAWNTSNYPDQSTGSGTAGAQFTLSTAGYNTISVNWMHRFSSTAANRIRLQYTVNGADWIDFEASEENAVNTRNGVDKGFDEGRYVADTNNAWFVRSADLSTLSGVDNNPLFAVRFVTEFTDGVSYFPVNSTNYGTGGTVRYDNVTFTGLTGTAPLITANPGNLSGFTYLVGEGPSASQTISFSGINLTPESDDITIAAPDSYEISPDGNAFTGSLTVPYTGAGFSNLIITIRLKAGLEPGPYNEMLNVSGGGASDLNIPLSGVVTSGLEPSLSDVILPRFIQGSVLLKKNRVPFAYYATLTNLTPNSNYRYFNRVVLSSESETSTGAGNVIFVNPTTKTFTRLTNPDLGIGGAYGEFTTDANGSFSGWFMTEPTSNATRFIPGNHLFMRIMLNDGNDGTTPVTFLTTQDSVRVISFGTSSSDTAGTAFTVFAAYQPKNFVFLYDNPEGTGRPLYGTQVESSGIDFVTNGSYAPFYTSIAGSNYNFGGIVPNNLPTGIQRFEERSITDGSIGLTDIAPGGVWPEDISTVNPQGGIETPIFLQLTLGLPEITGEIGNVYSYNKTLYIEFLESTAAQLEVIDLQGRLTATMKMNGIKDSFTLDIPAGIYLLKITTPEGIFTNKFYLK